MLRFLGTLSPGVLALGAAILAAAPTGFAAYKVGYWVGHRAGVKAGGDAVVVQVEKQNAKAGEAARRVKGAVDACYDRGGEWRQEDGTCDR